MLRINNHIEPAGGCTIINQYGTAYENIVNLGINYILATRCRKK